MTKSNLLNTIASLALALSLGCSAQPSASESAFSTTHQPLVLDGVGPWTTVPGPSGVFFKNRPAVLSTGGGLGSVRAVTVCATGQNNGLYCNGRRGTGNWSGWKITAPPPGVTLGASGPSLSAWNDDRGSPWQALAVRQTGGSCPNCVWIQSTDPTGTSKWSLVPNSGIANGFTGDLSLVQYSHHVFLIASTGGNPNYSAWYAYSSDGNGFTNVWTAWTSVPGQVFKAPVTATGNGNEILLGGMGTDGNPYIQKLLSSPVGPWYLFAGGSFGDSPSAFTTAVRDPPIPEDIMVIGMGSDHVQYEGESTAAGTVLNGWFATSQITFLTSPVMSPSMDWLHLDLAALGNTEQVVVGSWNRSAPSCADGTIEQIFQDSAMVGCGGAVTWPERASLCSAGSRVCGADEWGVHTTRGVEAPSHNYWTNDNLHYNGSASACWVSTTEPFTCNANQPMRLCTATGSDPEGNQCNWTHCTTGPNSRPDYFGGCNGNATAGTLCCAL